MNIVVAGTFAFRDIILESKKRIIKFGYEPCIYDLGGLGFGKKVQVCDFYKTNGFYHIIENSWKSKAIHKPKIIYDCMMERRGPVLYLDADALLVSKIDEIFESNDFDFGFTIRRHDELSKEPVMNHRKIMGQINAGVLFFNHTDKSLNFLSEWEKQIQTHKNDQLALNLMITEILLRDGVVNTSLGKILTVPTDIYNFYYFNELYFDMIKRKIKIFHLKNNLWLEWLKLKNFLT
jgi:hypothetical protein